MLPVDKSMLNQKTFAVKKLSQVLHMAQHGDDYSLR